MGLEGFKELRVWKEAKELAVEIYRLTSEGKLSRDFGLKDQMQRCAVSVASNIAEGYERNSNKEFVRFLYISKGSLSELRTYLEIEKEIGYIDDINYNKYEEICKKIAGMITKLIISRKNKV